MNPAVNTLVVVSLVVSLVLIATKHQFASLISTTFAATLIILSIPREVCEPAQTPATPAAPSIARGSRPVVAEPEKRPPPPRVVLAKPPPPVGAGHRVALTKPTEVQMLPACNDPPAPPEPHQMKDYIRNHGMYGVHGNLSCRMMQRSATADSGLLQPLNARNQMIKFLAADQLHAKDPHLISRKRSEQ